MNSILLLFFCCFVGISYVIGQREILSPWFVLCTMFLMCLFVVMLNATKWDVHFEIRSVSYLVTGISAWGVGSICAKGAKKKCHVDSCEIRYSFHYYPIIWVGCSMILMVIYIWKTLQVVPWTGNFTGWLRNIYDFQVSGGSVGFIGNQIFIISGTLAYISIYILLKRKQPISSILSILFYIICALISTDRNTIIQLFIYFICLWVLVFTQMPRKNINFKIIKKVAIALGIFVVAFFLFGKAKRYQSDFLTSIGNYTGAGLYAFNLHMKTWDSRNLLYGKETMYALIGVFHRLGIVANDFSQYRFDEFIHYTSPNGVYFSTNIYTALKRYVDDFGYFGVVLIPFFLGFIYELAYIYVKMKQQPMGYIFFAMLFYPIVFFPIMERLFTRLHLGTLYELFWMFAIYHVVFRKIKYIRRLPC